MLRAPRLGARKADPDGIVRSKSVMSIVRNLESSDLDIIHTAFSCICSMSGGGPSHRSESQSSKLVFCHVLSISEAIMQHHVTM